MKTRLLSLAILFFTSISLMAQVTGTVQNSATQAPIANKTVYLMGDSTSGSMVYMTTTTNASGQFSFANVGASNSYTVYTYDCNQSIVSQVFTSLNTVVTLQICVGNPSGSCQAVFSSYPDSLNPLIINFVDYSLGTPTSWAWNFGDGNTSTLQNPIHAYASNGTYTVTLTIITATCGDTTNIVVTVGNTTPSCQASFYSVPDTSNTNTIMFFDLSTGNPTSWSWDFGDGNTSNLQSPTHTYASTGTYNVTLTIASALCSNSTTNTIVVSSGGACQSAFSYAATPTNQNIIQFTDISTGGPTSWMWNFGDGTSSNVQNPLHTFGTGTYTVTLMIFGANCQSTSTQNVTISSGTTNYIVWGSVYAGSNNLDLGLIKIFETNGTLVDSVNLDSSGGYHFNNIPAGDYLIYAMPASNSVYTTTHAATYYINDILWSSATTLTVSANQSNVNINLALITPMNGTGSISGSLGTGSKSAVSGVIVNLLSNGMPVATNTTDANGNFVFNNLADGTYTIWAEIAGKTTTPIVVTLDAANPNSTNNDFVVRNNTVVPKTVSINNSSKSMSIKTYPNPVENNLNIAINMEKSSRVSVEIFNLAGQLIISNNYDLQAGAQTLRINLNDLAKGSYILKITDNANAHTQQLITKMK
ncbi:MAG: PKD domain-containing protein [Bacteroidales bacterium]|nr:PKD domain-containing protein [Bacteroidales bacterium]